MNALRKKINNTHGQMLSRFEFLLIIGITAGLVFWLLIGTGWLSRHQAIGEDNLRENTAESVARVNSNDGLNCPVDGRSDHCPHWTKDGYTGYYDDISNTIVGEKTGGYNSSSEMKVDGRKYYGAPGTMVIKVTCREGVVNVSWETGMQ